MMNYLLMIGALLGLIAILLDLSIFLLPIKRKYFIRKSRLKSYLLIVFMFVIFMYSYVPKQMISINSNEISFIRVQNGSTGQFYDIRDPLLINEIANDLSHKTYKKDKSSLFVMGYGYNVSLINPKGRVIEQVIVNATDRIRYKGYFYSVKDDQLELENFEQ